MEGPCISHHWTQAVIHANDHYQLLGPWDEGAKRGVRQALEKAYLGKKRTIGQS